MTAYIIRRLLLIVPTLLGIMLINFAVVQIVPGGPVEQMIAQMTGTAVESTARFSGADESETLNSFNNSDSSSYDSKYRGAQGLDPDVIKEIEELKDGMIIKGNGKITGGKFSSHGDHRLAMTLGIASLISENPIEIENSEVSNVSYPKFWETLELIGD